MDDNYYFPPSEKKAKASGITSEEKKNAGFPYRLRQLRNTAGESQAALSKALGVTKSTISLYETGDNVPDARTIRKMALHFGVSSDYLLGLSEAETNDKDIQSVSDFLGLSSKSVTAVRYIKDAHPFLRE